MKKKSKEIIQEKTRQEEKSFIDIWLITSLVRIRRLQQDEKSARILTRRSDSWQNYAWRRRRFLDDVQKLWWLIWYVSARKSDQCITRSSRSLRSARNLTFVINLTLIMKNLSTYREWSLAIWRAIEYKKSKRLRIHFQRFQWKRQTMNFDDDDVFYINDAISIFVLIRTWKETLTDLFDIFKVSLLNR